jgi:hypothetical protein
MSQVYIGAAGVEALLETKRFTRFEEAQHLLLDYDLSDTTLENMLELGVQ